MIAGSAGAVVVFGGLFQRAWLQDDGTRRPVTAGPDDDPNDLNHPDDPDDLDAGPGTVPLDDVLAAVPHPREVWAGLVLLCLVLAIGALWCLALAFRGDWDERLTGVLMLGLPAAALGWAAWRARVMWAPSADRRPLSPRDNGRERI